MITSIRFAQASFASVRPAPGPRGRSYSPRPSPSEISGLRSSLHLTPRVTSEAKPGAIAASDLLEKRPTEISTLSTANKAGISTSPTRSSCGISHKDWTFGKLSLNADPVPLPQNIDS